MIIMNPKSSRLSPRSRCANVSFYNTTINFTTTKVNCSLYFSHNGYCDIPLKWSILHGNCFSHPFRNNICHFHIYILISIPFWLLFHLQLYSMTFGMPCHTKQKGTRRETFDFSFFQKKLKDIFINQWYEKTLEWDIR